ncbi:MAG TPA: hypothetical protein VLK61_18805, partial [Aquabacterium sp.]|nr:hypothetical protein [Aquabacterium sp.]
AGQPLSAAVQGARARFQSDVMKSCHHGATDVTDEFLQAVNPFAFVVSSGDEESHVHPRPDLLGRLGKQGRGAAPLLLSTELLRSTREAEAPDALGRITRLDEKIEAAIRAGTDPAPDQASRLQLLQQLTRRNVEVYGAISLRSDGQRLVIAFLMERPRGTKRWQTYWYRHQGAAGFVPEPG